MQKMLVVLALLGLSGASQAADMSVPQRAQVVPVVSSWAGCYLGVHGGYSFNGLSLGDIHFDPAGGVVGGHIGCNAQYGGWVVGPEVSYTHFGLGKSKVIGVEETLGTRFEHTGSVRGRVGYTISEYLMPYVTGGIGLASAQIDVNGTTVSAATHFGAVYGGGVETKILQNWLVRLEYLRTDYGRAQLIPVRPVTNTLTLGVGYKF